MEDKDIECIKEVWVDNVKVVACILVVLGHFFPSLISADILPNYNLLRWFKQTIYYFHVPLFFVCSGYLYQKNSKVVTFGEWKRNVLKKLLALGIPYVTFSAVTWELKNVFSNSVNNSIDTNLFETLFVSPTSPYWYLYALFLLFLITPTFTDRRKVVLGLVIAFLFKILYFLGVGNGIYAISTVFANEIWFVFGMWLCSIGFSTIKKSYVFYCVGLILAILFGSISVVVFWGNISIRVLDFMMGMTACIAVVMIVAYVFRNNVQNNVFQFLSKYTLPIFLLHTICAAPVRILFLKMGITSVLIHVVVGLIVTFSAPIIIAKIISHSKVFNFFLYPTKFINIK